MLLTVTTTHRPATDLGYLLHKHPDRAQTFEVTGGQAHVFYPEANAQRCTAALLLEVDPIALVRGRGRRGGSSAHTLAHYVNDRPYAASSLLTVALRKVFGTAMSGRCDQRLELAATPIPLEVQVPAAPGAELMERLFAPLGWDVHTRAVPLDPQFRDWGPSRYAELTLTGTHRLAEALHQLYVLLPVLDGAKHYWVGPDEIDKLVQSGSGWLGEHPERELISRRYLAHQRSYVESATERLLAEEAPTESATDTVSAGTGIDVVDVSNAAHADGTVAKATEASTPGSAARTTAPGPAPSTSTEGSAPAALAQPHADEEVVRARSLAAQRRQAVLAALRTSGARSIIDLGCGEGALLGVLLREREFDVIAGTDVAVGALQSASRRLRLDERHTHQRPTVKLFQSSLVYRDRRLHGYDAAVLMEVVEHLDPGRLPALEDCVFGTAQPETVIVTTPNTEFNVRFPDLTAGAMRHTDHRFEWNRVQFREWAQTVSEKYGYRATFADVGETDPDLGPPTQLGVFTREGGKSA